MPTNEKPQKHDSQSSLQSSKLILTFCLCVWPRPGNGIYNSTWSYQIWHVNLSL